jgi:hypothetical protein
LTALDKNSWDGYGTVLLYDAAKPAKKGFPPSGGGHDTPKPDPQNPKKSRFNTIESSNQVRLGSGDNLSPFLFVLFNWSFIMNQFNKVIADYRAFLKAGTDYGNALRDAAKSLGGTPCPTLLEGLAKVHAEAYKCNYTWSSSGRAVFHTGAESTRDTRQDSARQSWQRNVMVHFKTNESFKAEVDVVAKMIKAMEKLTPAQRRKVLAAFN